MWKCKKCGCTDIIAKGCGGFKAEGIPNKYGDIDDFDILDIQDLTITGYECVGCNNSSSNVEDIAEWEED